MSRWGLPLMTHIFLSDPDESDLKEDFNRSPPSADVARFLEPVAEFVQRMTTYAKSSSNPAEYGKESPAVFVRRHCLTKLEHSLRLITRASTDAPCATMSWT